LILRDVSSGDSLAGVTCQRGLSALQIKNKAYHSDYGRVEIYFNLLNQLSHLPGPATMAAKLRPMDDLHCMSRHPAAPGARASRDLWRRVPSWPPKT